MPGKYKRSSEVLNKKFLKIAVPAVVAEICTMICVATDSIVAQHFIDNRSVAAIALLATFMTVFQVMHDLFGSCTTILITRKKCEVSNEAASRTLADMTVVILAVFSVIALIIAVGGKSFLNFLTDDRDLIKLAWTYYFPVLITSPLMEILLIIERSFKTEGNIAYFSARPVICNVANILLDILFVAVLHKGIVWLAYATIISNLLGYVWSLSYPLIRPCNITVDYRGILSKGRMKNTIREEVEIGSAYFFGDMIDLVNTGLTAKLVLMLGGSVGMVSYGIMKNIKSMVEGFVFPVVGNANIFSGALYAEEDRKGLSTITKTTVKSIIIFTGAVIAVLILIPQAPALIYDVTDSNQFHSMRICLLTFGFCILWDSLAYYIRTFLISIKRERLSTVLSIVQRLTQLGLIAGAALTGSITVIWLALGWSSFIFVTVFGIIAKKKLRFEEALPDYDMLDYTCELKPDSASKISEEVCRLLTENGISERTGIKTGLIIEDCAMLIIKENKGHPVKADIRVKVSDEEIKVFFYYDGVFIMKDKTGTEKADDFHENLEFTILQGMAENMKHILVARLNCLEFAVDRRNEAVK